MPGADIAYGATCQRGGKVLQLRRHGLPRHSRRAACQRKARNASVDGSIPPVVPQIRGAVFDADVQHAAPRRHSKHSTQCLSKSIISRFRFLSLCGHVTPCLGLTWRV
eukprot:1361489-Rhodomonas_salina.4